MAQFNQNNYSTVNKESEYYSDFLTNFDPHPFKKDLARYVNENAVKRSIRNLLSTGKYERLFNPTLGSKINNLLFEPIDAITTNAIQDAISETLKNHEPRAKVLSVTATPYPDDNAYFISIVFYIINNSAPVTFQTTLYRVR